MIRLSRKRYEQAKSLGGRAPNARVHLAGSSSGAHVAPSVAMSFVQDPVDVEHVPAANAAQEPASGIVSRYKTQIGAGTEISKWRLQREEVDRQDALVYFEVHKQVTQALDGFAHAHNEESM